jgi:carbon storage regulator CsrA
MLTITRRANEEVIIRVPGHRDITVCVVNTTKRRCQLSIQADEQIKILRREILDRESK